MRTDRDVTRKAVALAVVVTAIAPMGCKRKQAAPAAWKSGTTVIPGTFSWDAETNSIGTGEATDFWWEQVSPTERYLAPKNGSRIAVVKHRGYDQIDGAFLQRWHMPQEKISGSDMDGLLAPGTVIAFRTGEGTLGKLQVVGYRSLHDTAFPEADVLPEGWDGSVAGQPNVERYHLEIKWASFRP